MISKEKYILLSKVAEMVHHDFMAGKIPIPSLAGGIMGSIITELPDNHTVLTLSDAKEIMKHIQPMFNERCEKFTEYVEEE